MNRLLVWSLLLLFAVAFESSAVLREAYAAEGEKEATEEQDSSSDDSKAADAKAESESDAKSDSADDASESDKAADEADKDPESDKPEATDEKASDEKAAEDKEEDSAKEDDKQEKPKRKTFTVEAKPLTLEVTIDGVLVAKNMTEVKLDAEQWSNFEIEEVVEHGAKVEAGDQLVRFDDKDLNEAIAELELSQRIKDLTYTKREEDFSRLEESLERQLKLAQRAWDESQEDYKQYTEVERDLIVKQQEMRLKQAKFNLDYAKDELEQLTKMYEADDLTEETEEMILSRQKTQFEFAQFSFEIAKYNNELVLETLLPRQDVRLKESQRTVELALERAKLASELDLNRARYELEQARIQRRKDNEKHAELVGDKGLLTIRSPTSGVVYYGRCVDGKWGEVSSMMQKLLPEKSVPKGAVMMTIVDPAKMYVLGSVGEDDMPSIKLGQAAKLETKVEGEGPIEAKVDSIESIPAGGGKFGLEIELTGECPDWLVPGMTGKVKVTTYKKKDALLAPTDAVHTDEDSDRKYVWKVEEEDGETEVEKQWVKTGKSKGKEIEILDGVEEGDVLSLDPDEKGTDEKDDADDEEDSDDGDD